ncbi:protein of unknown function [Cupriavidus taiwanensis]|nr:protein of unknown function [Cupriavidus taiwanensis]
MSCARVPNSAKTLVKAYPFLRRPQICAIRTQQRTRFCGVPISATGASRLASPFGVPVSACPDDEGGTAGRTHFCVDSAWGANGTFTKFPLYMGSI